VWEGKIANTFFVCSFAKLGGSKVYNIIVWGEGRGGDGPKIYNSPANKELLKKQ
jgi:hypothetical protein